MNKQGLVHPNFLPAISQASKKAINQEMRSWHIQIKNDKSLLDISKMFNAVLRGWDNYYSRFYPSAMRPIWRHFNDHLTQWVRRKYKRFARHKRLARKHVGRLASANQQMSVN